MTTMSLKQVVRAIALLGVAVPVLAQNTAPPQRVEITGSSIRARLATEGARAVLRLAFETLKLPEVLSFTVPQNLRSLRVMERIGLVHSSADDFDHPNLPAGHPLRRHVLYRLSRAAWLASQPC